MTAVFSAEVLISGSFVVLLGIVGYFFRLQLQQLLDQNIQILNKLDVFNSQYVSCQTTLSERFASKSEMKYCIDKLVERTDTLHDRVSLLEGVNRRQ